MLAVVACSDSSIEHNGKTSMSFTPTGMDAKVWTFWHWVHGAVSKEGLTADLEAMKVQGIGGAYIFAIRDTIGIYEKQVVTYSPEWFELVKYAAKEANRLGIELGFNTCDGFTTAGGSWITPELSMQKVVWADTIVEGSQNLNFNLPQPESYKGYYKDISTYAYKVSDYEQDSWSIKSKVTTNMKDGDIQYISEKGNTKTFSSKKEGWIQYAFDKPFTCRTIQIATGWANYQSNRLIIEVSNDGINYRQHIRLNPPRMGWQDLYQPNTISIPPVTTKYFRFVFSKEGSEPGAEDIDDAKWTPKLQMKGLRMLSSASVNQIEAKNASIWRIAEESYCLDDNSLVQKDEMLNISKHVSKAGKLDWRAPAGLWKIIRIGHTSTGRENYIGGGARGLECDKLSSETVSFQFDKWFGEIYKQAGDDSKAFTRLLCDSWECGSQNWTDSLLIEFKNRRGYELLPYMPIIAGVPMISTDESERVLRDFRETIAELVAEKFSGTMAAEAHKLGVKFVVESTAPVGVGDGMLHHKYADYPMGEFWFRSPSHDKPNDILDAVSAAHIYGKPVVQAESFTEIRLDWNETPAMLKSYADRNLALGVNKMVNHVFVHNPWMDRKPGATLDKIGTFLQRDQTWWNMSNGFFSYLENCQKMLQKGTPVVDIAVFTGEEVPRRAILPDRLVNTLPGLFGRERMMSERKRLSGIDFSKYEMPRTVETIANMARPEDWVDPLRGYAYDSFNKDALLNLASVNGKGNIVLPSGMEYAMLIIPSGRKMTPYGGKGDRMSEEVARKIQELFNNGATILVQQRPSGIIGMTGNEKELNSIIDNMLNNSSNTPKKGKLLYGSYNNSTLEPIGLKQDLQSNQTGKIAWTHRRAGNEDIYFVANNTDKKRNATIKFRIYNEKPTIYNPVTDKYYECSYKTEDDGRIYIELSLDKYQSVCVLFGGNYNTDGYFVSSDKFKELLSLDKGWKLTFKKGFGGSGCAEKIQNLFDWSQNEDTKYYSGEAVYKNTFEWNGNTSDLTLDLGKVCDVAEVTINGKKQGVVWAAPYSIPINNIRKGTNTIEIKVANTWNNRLIGDNELPEEKRIAWTTAPYRLEGQPLLPAGLIGAVVIKVNGK